MVKIGIANFCSSPLSCHVSLLFLFLFVFFLQRNDFYIQVSLEWAFQVALTVKNLPANAGGLRDAD